MHLHHMHSLIKLCQKWKFDVCTLEPCKLGHPSCPYCRLLMLTTLPVLIVKIAAVTPSLQARPYGRHRRPACTPLQPAKESLGLCCTGSTAPASVLRSWPASWQSNSGMQATGTHSPRALISAQTRRTAAQAPWQPEPGLIQPPSACSAGRAGDAPEARGPPEHARRGRIPSGCLRYPADPDHAMPSFLDHRSRSGS